MTRIYDVAREASVSAATVSRALRGVRGVSDENRAKVLDAARRLGYVPSPSAVGLASGRTGAVAIIVADIRRSCLAQMVSGAAEALRAGGHDVLLYDLAADVDVRRHVLRAELLAKRADGVLVLGMRPTPGERILLAGLGRPVAIVARPVVDLNGRQDLAAFDQPCREHARGGAERLLAALEDTSTVRGARLSPAEAIREW